MDIENFSQSSGDEEQVPEDTSIEGMPEEEFKLTYP